MRYMYDQYMGTYYFTCNHSSGAYSKSGEKGHEAGM